MTDFPLGKMVSCRSRECRLRPQQIFSSSQPTRTSPSMLRNVLHFAARPTFTSLVCRSLLSQTFCQLMLQCSVQHPHSPPPFPKLRNGYVHSAPGFIYLHVCSQLPTKYGGVYTVSLAYTFAPYSDSSIWIPHTSGDPHTR